MASHLPGGEVPLNVTPITITPPNPSEFFKNEEYFPHANTPSTITETELHNHRTRYQIPDTHLIRVPTPQERMYQRPEGWTAMPVTLLEKGVHLPLHAFVTSLLRFVGVGFAQLVPNSYIHIMAFLAFCHEHGISPAIDLFFTLFIAGKSRERGFKMLSKQSPKPNARFEKRSLMDTPSSNQGWHKEWFFVKGPEVSSVPNWTTSDRISANFGNIPAERVREMASFLEKIHTKEWSFVLLSKQAWLYDHNLSLTKPTSIDRKDLDRFLSGTVSPTHTEVPTEEPLIPEAQSTESTPIEDTNHPRKMKQAGRKRKNIIQNDTEGILDKPYDERTRILRAKKIKTRANFPVSEEAQIPPAETDPPPTTPVDVIDSDEELEVQVKRPASRDLKRKANSSETRSDAIGSSTLWPETEDNSPFELYNSFVHDSDDHRFGNSSIINLIDEGMKYHAKASAVFGRLRPKYKETEIEEKAAQKENILLKSALAKNREDLKYALWDKEYLQKDLFQTKKDLKASRATHGVITDINIDLLKKNEIMEKKIEELVQFNSVLSKQNKDIQAKDAEQVVCRQKLEEELRELRAIRDLGPPLTDQLRERIRDEYRNSDELNKKVVKMFSDGYYDCRNKDKAKLVTVKVDPTILDSSEDESNV